MESNLIVWSLNQLKKRPLRGHQATVWKHGSAKPRKVYLASCLYFRSISMAVLGSRYDSHAKTNYKIRN